LNLRHIRLEQKANPPWSNTAPTWATVIKSSIWTSPSILYT
jgi:hypothetical protein